MSLVQSFVPGSNCQKACISCMQIYAYNTNAFHPHSALIPLQSMYKPSNYKNIPFQYIIFFWGTSHPINYHVIINALLEWNTETFGLHRVCVCKCTCVYIFMHMHACVRVCVFCTEFQVWLSLELHQGRILKFFLYMFKSACSVLWGK